MRLQILSDLHLEFHRDGGRDFISRLRPEGVDALVVAGDLATRSGLRDPLTRLCDRYPDVVYVVGNHEYYGSSPGQLHDELASIEAGLPNLHWLEDATASLGDVVFAGTALWFPPSPEAELHRGRLNDFHQIRDFDPWVYETNEQATAFLDRVGATADVVVTHHLPSARSVAREYEGSPFNAFFVSDCERLIERAQPPLWLHGHTHGACDYRIGATRVVCNPLGYPGESGPRFDDRLVVEVSPRS